MVIEPISQNTIHWHQHNLHLYSIQYVTHWHKLSWCLSSPDHVIFASFKLKQLCASNWLGHHDIFLFNTSLIRLSRKLDFERNIRFQQVAVENSLKNQHCAAISSPRSRSSSNLSALFLNLYPLLPNLKVSLISRAALSRPFVCEFFRKLTLLLCLHPVLFFSVLTSIVFAPHPVQT